MATPATSRDKVPKTDRPQAGGTAAAASRSQPHPTVARQHCAACGRYVGPYERCPYCGARMPGRLTMRFVKIAALLLATVGLAMVWWAARASPIPTIPIGEATGQMNLAYVRLAGRVTRSLTYDPESGYLGFWIADATGEVHVNIYREVTTALLARGTVPAIGDAVSVAGTLRVRDDFLSLTLGVPEHLTVTRTEPQPIAARAITVLDEGLRVRVVGDVAEVRSPYSELTLIDVQDESGTITVAVDETTVMLSEAAGHSTPWSAGMPGTATTGVGPEDITAVEGVTTSRVAIAPGMPITVEGAVTLYKTMPQIVPATLTDIEIGPAGLRDTTEVITWALNELYQAPLGGEVCIRGEVVMLEGLPGGMKATLDDGTAEVPVVLWDDVYLALPAPRALDVGAAITVTGKVKDYQGTLEVIPETEANVVIGVPAPPPPWVDLGALSARDAGRVVRARGIVGETHGFSAGVKVPLNDGSGEIVVLFWSDVYASLAPAPQVGQQVEVVGVVSVYKNTLELIPRSRYDWHVRILED